MPIPNALRQIATDVAAGQRRRAKVRTLLGYYGLHRRREAGLASIRADLEALGLETRPDLATAGFDEQIRFVPLGSQEGAGPDEPLEAVAEPSDYEIEPEPGVAGGPARYRLLLRAYDAFERLRGRLINERLATILQAGQNAARETRDRFPFYISLDLGAAQTEQQLAVWAEEAASLSGSSVEPEESTPDAVEPSQRPAVVVEAILEQVTALSQDLRASVSRQLYEAEQRLGGRFDEIRFDTIRKLVKELKDEEALRFVEEYETETKARLAAKDSEIGEYVREIGLLEERISQYEEQAVGEGAYDPEDAYPTMVDTVRLFEDLSQNAPVLVHDNALKAAARSGSVRRREVLEFLLTLKELAEQLYRRGGVSEPFKKWFSERGYEYAPKDSETTSGKYGKEREIPLEGKTVQLEEHVTLFANSPNCVSVYFYRDEPNRTLVVGYVGPHLSTTSR